MRLITWNTRHLTARRRDAVLELEPDILVLQEVYSERPPGVSATSGSRPQ